MAGRLLSHAALRARRCRIAAALLVACLLAALALAPAAVAGGPASHEYSFSFSGGGNGKAGSGGGRIADSSGSSILPMLLIGGAVIASGSVALAYLRHRRNWGKTT